MRGPIAVFDSGVGGLTVVKELLKQLPNEAIVYFGDTARAPYGPRPKDEVVQFSEEIVQMLMNFHPKLIVIACNTATAVALDSLRGKYNTPIIGVIEPGARAALRVSQKGYIAVIGTEGTIKSKAYDRALQVVNRQVNILSQACPTFVPLVEQGLYNSSKAFTVVDEAIGHMRNYPLDCLILGCTHYPFLSDIIAEVLGPSVRLIQSAEETAREAAYVLKQQSKAQTHLLVSKSTAKSTAKSTENVHRFICSGELSSFQAIIEQWLASELSQKSVVIERINNNGS